MRFGSLLVLFAIAGCSGGEDKDDLDGDGFVGPDDCEERDPAIYPGAPEDCDGIDNNCNGEIDEFARVQLFADLDGDGHGGVAEQVCADSPGYVREGDDCDDSDPDVNPDAEELCDELDRNCDGDPYRGAADFPTFFFDDDRDGFGDDESTLSSSCVMPAGYSEVAGDCDDERADVNPDAEEVCNGRDDDCDGGSDLGAADAATYYDDADRDGFGDPGTGSVRCVTVGLVANDDDCDDTSAAVKPTANEICNGGVDDDCSAATDEDQLDGDTWYRDADADTFGDPGTTATACTQPAGYVDNADDCDDGDNAIRIGLDWYDDNDLDGHGNPAIAVTACAQPYTGFVLLGDDCNDGSAATYPGAVEICDGLANDCFGAPDVGAVDASTFYFDGDADLFGDPAQPIVACDQPPGTSLAATDCDDSDPATFPGSVEICDGGGDNDCDPSTDESFTAVNYRDADGDGFGNENDTVFGCSPPLGYVQVGGDCDDTDDTVNPTTTPNCTRVHCGQISLSETWRPPLRHQVTCDVFVQGAARPTLTVAAGTVVEFATNTSLVIGNASEGRLVVEGDPLVPARFTSDDAVKAPGQWRGLVIDQRDTGSTITHLIVDSAGQATFGQPAGVTLVNADVVIDDLRSVDNLGAGLLVTAGSEPLVVRSTLAGNTGNGLYVTAGAGLSRLDERGTQGPSFQDNLVTDNGLRPITIPGSHADEIDPTNLLSPNGTQEIELLSGVLRFTGSWYDHSLPYVVAPNALIEVEDGPLARLTIEDNVEVYFSENAELAIGVDAGGSLFTGLDTLFTGTPFVLANSLNWRGVVFGPFDLGSVVSDLEVAYGGANGRGNLYVVGSSPTIRRVYSHHSDYAGIWVAGSTAAPRIEDSDITDNDTDGVYVESNSGVARDLAGPTFANNLLTRNGGSSVVFPPSFLGELDPSTTFVGNGDRIGVHGGVVADDALWRELDEDYEVRGDVFIGGPRDPVVDVEDRVTIYFERDASLRAGTADDGVLRVNGTAAGGVLFTSSDPAPGKGDWEGLVLGGAVTAAAPAHSLNHLVVEYAGGSDVDVGGAIEFVARSQCGPSQELFVNDVTVRETTKASYFMSLTGTVYFDGFATDGSQDQAFHFFGNNPPCTYEVRSAGSDEAQGLEVFGVLGNFPIYQLTDLADPSNVFFDSPRLTESTVSRDSYIPDIGFPIIVETMLQVGGGAAPTLEIAPNVELQFRANTGITCGQSGQGYLFVDQATFTSALDAPSPGDWQGFVFGSACAVRMSDSLIEYAGSNGYGALYNQSSCCGQAPTQDVFLFGSVLLGNTVKDSSSCGLYNFSDQNGNPDADRDGLVDATLLPWPPYFAPNGTLPEFATNFQGSIGGTGTHCPIVP